MNNFNWHVIRYVAPTTGYNGDEFQSYAFPWEADLSSTKSLCNALKIPHPHLGSWAQSIVAWCVTTVYP